MKPLGVTKPLGHPSHDTVWLFWWVCSCSPLKQTKFIDNRIEKINKNISFEIKEDNFTCITLYSTFHQIFLVLEQTWVILMPRVLLVTYSKKMVPVNWKVITFSFPVFKFSKYFPSHWKCQALYQLFHVRKAPRKIGLIPLVETTMGPIIPCLSDIICCSLHSWRKCWNAKKQL